MHRVPHPLMAVDDACRFGLFEREIERAAPMADPFSTPLPPFTRLAPLQQQLVVGQAVPKRCVETVASCDRGWQSR